MLFYQCSEYYIRKQTPAPPNADEPQTQTKISENNLESWKRSRIISRSFQENVNTDLSFFLHMEKVKEILCRLRIILHL